MSYKYSFADNAEYGAEDLNSLVASLVSAGVADPFTDGESYNASKLNDSVSLLYTEGVVPENINTLKVTKVSDGVISIAPGLAFFADGSTLRVTEAEVLSYTLNEENYVYLKQDLTEQNRNYPACTTEPPTGDFVLLAEISADGTITDKRMYAKGKVPGYQSNANFSMTVEKSIYVDMGTNASGTVDFSIDLGANTFSKAFFIGQIEESFGEMGIYNLADGSHYCIRGGGNSNTWGEIHTDKFRIKGLSTNATAYITFSQNGNILNGLLSWNSAASKSDTFKFSMTFC